jgi:hypothetical protein
MSEYQYYEWLSIDRPLLPEEQRDVNKLSSHITVSATGAWVDYSWGDFKHDPKQVLASYFDAFLYIANWGTKELMFRFPQNILDPQALQPYMLAPYITLNQIDDCYLLSFQLDNEEPEDWVEGAGRLATLSSLRTDILHEDYRCLYIMQSHLIEYYGPDEMEEDVTPAPIPPGLDQLTPALHSLMEFFQIDPPQIDSSTQTNSAWQAESEADLEMAIHKLPREEAEAFLLRLFRNEPHLSVALRRRLRDLI